MKCPFQGLFEVTQVYKGINHKGVDLVGLDGETVYCTVDGEVEVTRWDTHITGGMGLYVRVRETSTGLLHYFAHLANAYVVDGDSVRVGTALGLMGSTGHSTGKHLHYEIREYTDNTTFINVSLWSGIPNILGRYTSEPLTVLQAKKIVRDALGYEEKTVAYIADYYIYGTEAITRLANYILGVKNG